MARQKRDWFDKATLGTAVIGIVVAVATLVVTQCDQASSGRDTARAIAGIENMAGAMANQAQVMQDEKPNIVKQANAAADSAAAAKSTAELAKGQTDAVLRQAAALIESAKATSRAASAQLAGAQASIKTADAGLKAAEEQRRSATIFASTRAPAAEIAKIELDGWPLGVTIADRTTVKINIHVKNIGGSTLKAGFFTFNLQVGELPITPPAEAQTTMGGNETYTNPGDEYGNLKPIEYLFTRDDINAVNNGTKAMFVWGKISFTGVTDTPYQNCYVLLLRPQTQDAPSTLRRLNIAGYECPPAQAPN